MVVPERRAAIGAPQDLDDEEKYFLKIAFELKLPMVMQQRNPKTQRSTSRARYEKYKSAKTLWKAKKLGAESKDIVWDYERGYIDFSPLAASDANLVELIDTWEQRGIASSTAAYVDKFVMSPWTTGECDWVLNMTVKRDYKEGILHLSQPLAIEKLAEKFKLTGREGYAPHVPMAPNLKLIKPADEDIVPYSTWDYRSAVGGLLYLSLTTRPDVAQAVGVLSRFMSYPGQEHVDAAKQVIRYLYGTKEYGIEYRRDKGNAPHQDHAPRLTAYTHTRKSDIAREDSPSDSHLIGTYCDADYAGDAGTRKSTGGYGILMAGGLICWSSKLQPTVALSTAEAETMAGLEAVKQLMHLRLFLKELGNEQHGPSVVFEDNNAAISIAHGKEQSKRSKHYQIKVHFLNEAYKSGIFAYEKVPTKEMLADAFTKSLPREDFSKYRGWMGVNPPPTSEV